MICHLSPDTLQVCSQEVLEACDCYCSERGDGGENSWQEQQVSFWQPKNDPGSSGKRLGANFAVYNGAQSR